MNLALPEAIDQRRLTAEAARPRILLFLHSFDPGGVERVGLRLAGAWARAGCEVTIAMGRRAGPLASEAPAGVTFEFAPSFSLARRCKSLWLVAHLAGLIRRKRPDVLFCAGNTYAIVAVLTRLLLGPSCPPIVCKISNSLIRTDFSEPMRLGYAVWLRLQGRFIASFVGLTEGLRAELVAGLGIPPERVAIVPDPALSLGDITLDRPVCADDLSRGRRLLAVGRLMPQKDFALLLRAFAMGRGSHDRLVILGEGPERPRLERLVAELGIHDQVSLPGHATNVASSMAWADALVLSSRYEGAPAVVLEALAKGLRVVATDCSAGMADLLPNGGLGELVPPGDPQRLSEAMFRVEPATIDKATLHEHLAEFAIERAAPRYLELFARVIAERAGSLAG